MNKPGWISMESTDLEEIIMKLQPAIFRNSISLSLSLWARQERKRQHKTKDGYKLSCCRPRDLKHQPSNVYCLSAGSDPEELKKETKEKNGEEERKKGKGAEWKNGEGIGLYKRLSPSLHQKNNDEEQGEFVEKPERERKREREKEEP